MLSRRSILLAAVTTGLAPFASGSEASYELVMVEEHGCPWCARWNAEIGPIYPKTGEGRVAPLRRIDIADVGADALKVKTRVIFTPTFILARQDTEIGRIEGYPGEELFWWLLSALMKDNDVNIGGDTE